MKDLSPSMIVSRGTVRKKNGKINAVGNKPSEIPKAKYAIHILTGEADVRSTSEDPPRLKNSNKAKGQKIPAALRNCLTLTPIGSSIVIG